MNYLSRNLALIFIALYSTIAPSNLETTTTFIFESLNNSLSYLVEPNKRIYIPYLFSSALLACYVYFSKKRKVSLWSYLFSKKIWLSKSAKVDYSLLIFNGFIKVLFIIPLLYLANHLAIGINDFLIELFGFPTYSLNRFTGLILYTLSLTLIADFFSYSLHFLMHKLPILWEFHKIHHAADSLNPITQYRIHPVELLLNNLKNILAIGITTGIFYYLIGFQLEKITILGVNIFSFLFLSFGANLRHSHVKLKYYNWLENILISPFQHQIHHSDNPAHFDKNLGSKFAVWDLIFGTLIRSKEVTNITFGLGKDDATNHHFLRSIYQPFALAFKRVTNFKLNKKQKS